MQKNVWGYFRCPNGSDKEKGTDMKEMIKKMREERGGFTLAELLVVVAIVAVLVAIAVEYAIGVAPNSLTSAEEAVKKANERSVKAEVTTGYLADGFDKTKYNNMYYSANDKGDLTGPASAASEGAKYVYKVTIDDSTDKTKPTITVTDVTDGEPTN